MTAASGQDPGLLYNGLTQALGTPFYERLEAQAPRLQKAILAKAGPEHLQIVELAGEPVIAVETTAPGGGASLGGVRVRTRNGWFAARPSGTEEVYKIYAESFLSRDHLQQIQREAQALIGGFFERAGGEPLQD